MRDWKTLIIIIAVIILLSLVSLWRFQQFEESLSEAEAPKLEMPEIKLTPETKKELKEFKTADNKLKIKYSSDWLEGGQQLLKTLNQSGMIEEAKPLFFAYQPELAGVVSFLLVQEIDLTKEEKIIELMKKNTRQKAGKIEIIEQKKENNVIDLEIRLTQKKGLALHAKEKIFLTKEKSYLVAFFALEKDWSKIKEKAISIFNSIEFSP